MSFEIDPYKEVGIDAIKETLTEPVRPTPPKFPIDYKNITSVDLAVDLSSVMSGAMTVDELTKKYSTNHDVMDKMLNTVVEPLKKYETEYKTYQEDLSKYQTDLAAYNEAYAERKAMIEDTLGIDVDEAQRSFAGNPGDKGIDENRKEMAYYGIDPKTLNYTGKDGGFEADYKNKYDNNEIVMSAAGIEELLDDLDQNLINKVMQTLETGEQIVEKGLMDPGSAYQWEGKAGETMTNAMKKRINNLRNELAEYTAKWKQAIIDMAAQVSEADESVAIAMDDDDDLDI